MPSLLFFLKDALVAQRFDFPDDCEVHIGRGPTGAVTCAREGDRFVVRVGSPTLSEAHCALRVERGAVHVTDLGSRNGTLTRATPGVRFTMEGRVLQLGTDLMVREADARWILSEATIVAGPAALCAWMNEHLGASGLRAALAEPAQGSLPLVGEAKHLVARAVDGEGTLDAHDASWVRWAVGRYNTAVAARERATSWSFAAASSGRRRALEQAQRAAASSLPVLLVGPSGSGKSVLAQGIHEHSGRRGGPFVTLDCATLDADRLAHALFGDARGAPGLAETAHSGTLFLDAVSEIPASAQAPLLRFLESERGEYQRVGETRPRFADVRVIAATSRDPEDPARLGTALYHRLAGVRIDVPALEGSDAALLASAHPRTSQPPQMRASSVPPSADPRVQPAALGRLLSEIAFLMAAKHARNRTQLAARTQMTWQGADQRLAGLGVTLGDVRAIDARLSVTIDELRAHLRDAPTLAAVLRSLASG